MHAILSFALLTVAIPVRPDRHGPPPLPPTARTTLAQGSWQMISYQLSGKVMPQTTVENMSIVIDGGELRLTSKLGKATAAPYEFTFDASKSPATFEFKAKASKIAFSGIYKVEGDVLTMVFVRDGAERPKTFDVPADGRAFYYWQLRRVGK